VAPSTAARYAVSLGQLQPFLDGLFLDEIDGARVAEIIRQRRAHKVTNATIKRDLVALSSVIGCAIDQGWREDNPVLARMKRLKERRDPIMLPEPAHIQMVMDRAPGMLANMVEAAWKTGARQEELAAARRSQMDNPRRELTLIGKGNKRRTISLDPFADTKHCGHCQPRSEVRSCSGTARGYVMPTSPADFERWSVMLLSPRRRAARTFARSASTISAIAMLSIGSSRADQSTISNTGVGIRASK
jgi:site-specific recombinase XerC